MQKILTAWLQLLDSSSVGKAEDVDKFLRELGGDDESWETGDMEPLWNPAFTYPLRYSVLYWGGGPPDFKLKLDPLKKLLVGQEFLLFSVSYGLGHRKSTQDCIVIAAGVTTYAATYELTETLIATALENARKRSKPETGIVAISKDETSPQASGIAADELSNPI